MYFSKTLASTAMLALGPMAAYAAFPVASVEFLSWESCDVGAPTTGHAKFTADVTATPVTCDKATVNRDWNIDNYSFNAKLDTKAAAFCEGVTVWNNDGCSGDPVYYLPLDHSPKAVGVCLPGNTLEPGYVSFKLDCSGFSGAAA